jgi:hypothetical protein
MTRRKTNDPHGIRVPHSIGYALWLFALPTLHTPIPLLYTIYPRYCAWIQMPRNWMNFAV